MRHDPSLYIGIGKDGFLPPENSGPFDPDTGTEQPMDSSSNFRDTRLTPTPWLGIVITGVVVITLAYLFLT